LIISVLGSNRADLVSELTRACTHAGCNLLHINSQVLGTELAATLFLSGNWGAIAKMEALMPSLEQRLSLNALVRRTHEPELSGQWMVYNLQLVAIDHPGILQGLSDFLFKDGIPIEEITAHTYQTQPGTRMVSMLLKIKVPETQHLASLREKLIGYCDDHNLDAYVEAWRP
jgi:glycine cleavage system transcriptional repressor